MLWDKKLLATSKENTYLLLLSFHVLLMENFTKIMEVE